LLLGPRAQGFSFIKASLICSLTPNGDCRSDLGGRRFYFGHGLEQLDGTREDRSALEDPVRGERKVGGDRSIRRVEFVTGSDDRQSSVGITRHLSRARVTR
jgi:hypothetical protein